MAEQTQALPPVAAIASAHPLATDAGHEILARGGNAFDAAIAITATLAVVEPYSSGLGGGGFWLLHRDKDNKDIMIDGRERAPLAASRDMYLDVKGNVIPGRSINGSLAAGIPGVPAAIVHLAKHYGRLPLKQSLAPAIKIAQQGFAVDSHYQRYASMRLQTLRQSSAAARVFLDKGNVPGIGFIIKQPDLARTLELIANKGRAGFYSGKLADTLVKGVRTAGGIWTSADFEKYRVVERQPIRSRYRGMEIVSVSPPSSGGIAIATVLNILSGYDLARHNRVERSHLIIEAMRRAYRDRAEFLGDSDYVRVPVQKLTSIVHASHLRSSIKTDKATASDSLPPAVAPDNKGRDTTHFSILDRKGNRVAATLSINYLFGSGFMVPGTGVVLNDEMDDFSAKPGTPNVYGLVGAEANAIAPGKRPLSSMSPTFLVTNDRVAILGTPGGSRIISMVLLAALDFINGGSADSMVNIPRFHHQYLPDVVQFEKKAFTEKEIEALQRKGHKTRMQAGTYGNMQVVVWDRKHNQLDAASDPRGIGKAVVK